MVEPIGIEPTTSTVPLCSETQCLKGLRVYCLNFAQTLPTRMGIADRRTGAKAYQHPDLVAALAAMDPAAKLLQLIDEQLENRLPGIFTASEIERYLTERDSPTCREARILLQYANSCGTYLARLAQTTPERVSLAGTLHRANKYRISRHGDKDAV